MRIALFGAGSIGGPIAAHLLRGGVDLTVFTGNEEIAEAIRASGLRVGGLRGDLRVRAAPLVSPAGTTGPFDVALLAMKTNRLLDGVRAALPVLAPEGFVVCLQNGVPEPKALSVAGSGRVVGGVVGWGASMLGPGSYEVTSRGRIILGEVDGPVTPRITALAELLSANGLPARTTGNLAGVRWSKLAINCTVTSVGALCGVPIGTMVQSRQLRDVSFTIMSEVADVAAAERVRLEKVAGTFHLSSMYVPQDGQTHWASALLRHGLLRAVGVRFKRQRSGITRSLERGRRPEIDALNAFVVERAGAHGIPVPLNSTVARFVEELAAGRRAPGMQIWEELLPLTRGVSKGRVALD